MNESVQFDLAGEDHLDFTDAAVTHTLSDVTALRLPARVLGRAVITNQPLYYHEISWVGIVRRKQWWTLIPSILFIPLGMLWTATNLNALGPLGFSLFALFVLGIFPAWLFIRGRPFLAIAGEEGLILIPADRQCRKLRRILGLLAHAGLPEGTIWQLQGTPFEDPSTWDMRTPKETGFDIFGYGLFAAGIFILAISNEIAQLLSLSPKAAVAVRLTGCAILGIWIARFVIVRLKDR